MLNINDLSELCGTDLAQAECAKKNIASTFEKITESSDEDIEVLRLRYASKSMYAIIKFDPTNTELCTELICQDFSTHLSPDACSLLWTSYMESIRSLFHKMANQKKHKECWQIVETIAAYKKKVTNERSAKMFLQIYCYHYILQMNHYQAIMILAKNKNNYDIEKTQIIYQANFILDLIYNLLKEMYVKRHSLNIRYRHIFTIILKCIFPKMNIASHLEFYLKLNPISVTNVFLELFKFFDDNTLLDELATDERSKKTPEEYAKQYKVINLVELKKEIVEQLYCLIQLDLNINQNYDLSSSYIHTIKNGSKKLGEQGKDNSHFMNYLDFLLDLMDFIRVHSQPNDQHVDFTVRLNELCYSYDNLLRNIIPDVTKELWFTNSLVIYLIINTKLLDIELFAHFWEKMKQPLHYELIISLTTTVIKLCSKMNRETNLFHANCCTSVRKHIVLALTQNVLSYYILYCQSDHIRTIELQMEAEKRESDKWKKNKIARLPKITSPTKNTVILYPVKHNYVAVDNLKSNLSLIVKYAYSVLDQMSCINVDSFDMKAIVTRYKRIAVNIKTKLQLDVYTILMQHLFIYKHKMTSMEWVSLMKYNYVVLKQTFPDDISRNREAFICYLSTLLKESKEIDWSQIRGFVSNYYDIVKKSTEDNQSDSDSKKKLPKSNDNDEQGANDKNNNKVNAKNSDNGEKDKDTNIFESEDDESRDSNDGTGKENQDKSKDDGEFGHEKCLYHAYTKTRNPLLGILNTRLSNLLFWFDMQYLMKYQRNNTKLIESIFSICTVDYYRVILARFQRKEEIIVKWLDLYRRFFNKEQQLFECFDETTNNLKDATKIMGNLNMMAIKNDKNPSDTKIANKVNKDLHLSRLEALVYGHCCVLLLQHDQDQFKAQGKYDFNAIFENNLDELVQTDGILNNVNIGGDTSKRLHNTVVIYRAFKYFFEMTNLPIIDSDEALIEWDFLLEDLEYLAYTVQVNGNLEFAADIWLLHYKCAKLLDHRYGSYQGLAFLCENAYLLKQRKELGGEEFLTAELAPVYLYLVDEMKYLDRNLLNNTIKIRQFCIVLILALQISYYLATVGKHYESETLLKFILIQHKSLNTLQGKEVYNCIMATYDTVRLRILWKHHNQRMYKFIDKSILKKPESIDELDKPTILPEVAAASCSLFVHIENTLERFRNYVSLHNMDLPFYSISLLNVLHDIVECVGNRLSDVNIQGYFLTAIRLCIESGLTLRFIRIMIAWMWLNLQQEYIDKAEMKLKIISYVLKLKSTKELRELRIRITSSKNPLMFTTPDNERLGIEDVRKVAQNEVPLVGKQKPHDVTLKMNLLRFFKYKMTAVMPQEIEKQSLPSYKRLMKWLYFTVGCMVARLYYLAGDYKQLDNYFNESMKWLNCQNDGIRYPWQCHIHLLQYQYYATYLQSKECFDETRQCMETLIDIMSNLPLTHIDTEFFVNIYCQVKTMNVDEWEKDNNIVRKVDERGQPAIESMKVKEDAAKPADEKDAAKPADEKNAAKPADEKDAAKPADEKDAAKPADEKDAAKPADEKENPSSISTDTDSKDVVIDLTESPKKKPKIQQNDEDKTSPTVESVNTASAVQQEQDEVNDCPLEEINHNREAIRVKKKTAGKAPRAPKLFTMRKKLSAPLLNIDEEALADAPAASGTVAARTPTLLSPVAAASVTTTPSTPSFTPQTPSNAASPRYTRILRSSRKNAANMVNSNQKPKSNTKTMSSRRRRDL